MKIVSPELLAYSPFNGQLADVTGPDFVPSDNGLLGWCYDPLLNPSAGFAQTTSTIYMIKIKASITATVGNLLVVVIGAGVTFTSSSAALYSNAGVKLGETASMNTLWASTGLKTCPLSVGVAVTAGTYYHIALRQTATTRATFGCITPVLDVGNAGLGPADARWATASGTNTTMVTPITMSGRSNSTSYIWAALKA